MKIRGARKLKRKLNNMSESVRADKLETAARAGAFPISNEAKRRAPKKSGTLARSIGPETTHKTATKVKIAIGTNVVYARIHEYGGVITPKQADMLHFTIDGKEIFTDEVQMPARPYLRPAFDEKKREAEKEMRDAWVSLIKGAI